jgi:hypothetical protein
MEGNPDYEYYFNGHSKKVFAINSSGNECASYPLATMISLEVGFSNPYEFDMNRLCVEINNAGEICWIVLYSSCFE